METHSWNVEWIGELIPDLELQVDQFVVDTEEMDDELVEVFISEIRRLTGELQAGDEAGDTMRIAEAAHSIKGMGGTMGLPEISVLGREIEQLAKADRLPDARRITDALAYWMATLD